MLFKVMNEGVDRHSHCGVLEFSAPEGTCYMPYWVRVVGLSSTMLTFHSDSVVVDN
jgi:hypothetical protein